MDKTNKTIASLSEKILFKEKNSKFFGYAFPIQSGTEIIPNAIIYRINDDGEPSNTAGIPIYGRIQYFGLTNILVVIVRFFGGIKLGVGGLISAYQTAAQMTFASSEIIGKTINIHFQIAFDYKNNNKVMRVIKEKGVEIVLQKMEMSCGIEILVRKKMPK